MTGTKKKLDLHWMVLIGMLMGAIAGGICQATLGTGDPNVAWFNNEIAKPLGQLFLRLIYMIVIPLLFSALTLGVLELGGSKKLGRIGLKTLGFTVVLSGIAVALAIAGANLVKPGGGIGAEQTASLMQLYGKPEDAAKSVEKAKEAKGPGQTILDLFPANPVEEAAKPNLGGVLPFMVFALFFGVALAAIEPEVAAPVKSFLEGLFAVTQKLVEYAMRLAPLGVAALMFGTVSQLGWDAFAALGKYAGLVLALLLFQMLGVYSIVLRVFAKRNPLQFFHSLREVILTAFGTSSSNATLPVALRVSQEKAGIPRDISNFVLTVGATGNQNGTALFEGVTVLFLAQAFGVTLDVTQQLTVVGLAVIAGIGTAGVPGGAWPMIAAILGMLGVPPAAIGLCLGIDRILDMSRTVVNVVGDITIAACVAGDEQAVVPVPS